MFSPMTGQTRPILPEEDSKGERQEERVREAHREESGDLGVSWGYLGGILGGSGGDLGVLEVGSGWGNRGSGGLRRIFFHCKNIKRVTLSLLPQSPFLFFCAAEGVALFMFFAMAEGSGHSS